MSNNFQCAMLQSEQFIIGHYDNRRTYPTLLNYYHVGRSCNTIFLSYFEQLKGRLVSRFAGTTLTAKDLGVNVHIT